MKKQPSGFRLAGAGVALLAGTFLIPASTHGQGDLLPPPNLLKPAAAPVPVAPAVAQPSATEVAIAALAEEIAQQQVKIAENQKLIDEKLALIAENLRIARIYVSRSK